MTVGNWGRESPVGHWILSITDERLDPADLPTINYLKTWDISMYRKYATGAHDPNQIAHRASKGFAHCKGTAAFNYGRFSAALALFLL